MVMLAASGGDGWFGLVFAGFGGLFLLIGLGMAFLQSRRMRTYLPVPAVVVSSYVKETAGSKGGSTYTPSVTYEYKTPGGPKTSSKTMAIEMSTSDRGWAERIVGRYPPGSATLAYVHPTKDDHVFLVHEITIFPYWFAMFSMIFVSIGLGIALNGMGPAKWHDADRLFAVAMGWHAVGLLCFIHYRLAGGRFTLAPQLTFALYVGVGLIALIAWDDLRKQPPVPATPVAVQRPVRPSPPSTNRPNKRPASRPARDSLPPVEKP